MSIDRDGFSGDVLTVVSFRKRCGDDENRTNEQNKKSEQKCARNTWKYTYAYLCANQQPEMRDRDRDKKWHTNELNDVKQWKNEISSSKTEV